MEISKQQKDAIQSLIDVYRILEPEEMENLLWDLLVCAFASDNIKDWDGERRASTVFNTRLLLDFFKSFYLLENQMKSFYNEADE
jgi:hypothetical protein